MSHRGRFALGNESRGSLTSENLSDNVKPRNLNEWKGNKRCKKIQRTGAVTVNLGLGTTQLAEGSPGIHEAPGPIPAPDKLAMIVYTCNSST